MKGKTTSFVLSVFLSTVFCIILDADKVDAQDNGGLYDETIVRTIHLEFRQSDWWEQMERNYAAEENIPADLILDGIIYPDVGVRFKGDTSYRNTGDSQKKSFNIEIDDNNRDQRLMGYRTLNLNNAYNDPTFIREVLFSNVVRKYIPSAKANFVKLTINGENWGIYANVQQINRDLIEEWFPSSDGTRWRAEGGGGGGPGGGGPGGGFSGGDSALTWLGNDVSAYETVYDVRSNDSPEAWAALMRLCDVLNNTPLDQLSVSLAPVLDIERALMYLAVENVFVDEDGYLFKGADYFLYWEVETGRFHTMQHDANEVMGASFNRLGPESWSPFEGETNANRPLISRLLSVSSLRQSYIAQVRTLIDEALNITVLEPKIEEYRSLIRDDVMADTKKLYSNAAFENGIVELKNFIQDRRAFLLSYPEIN